jgi:hypothetical protein
MRSSAPAPVTRALTRCGLPIVPVAIGAVLLLASPLVAQPRPGMPLAPEGPRSDIVVPIFDGWWENPDGSVTLSFGFFNMNSSEPVEVPVGEDNFIEPREFDGLQPTHFPVVSYGGFNGNRERGAFAVTLPAQRRGEDVVWTIRREGQAYSVPGRATSPAYELSLTPQAAGSLRPAIRFQPDGETGHGPGGLVAPRIVTSVGTPTSIPIWVEDRGEREERFPVNFTWQKHQGPGSVEFVPATGRVQTDRGLAETAATFALPGEYMIRVRVDNFTTSDSSFGNQCCWTNGFIPVTVNP